MNKTTNCEPGWRSRQVGFTLIELMITVAVIAILAAVALPSYREYVLRGNRLEAQALLSDAAARQERWRAQNGSYTTDATKLQLPFGVNSEHGFYTLSIAANGAGYVMTATRAGSQTSDQKCGEFTLTDQGEKGIKAGTPGTKELCWR
ncbi:prepilin-type N-terminal cleavage/methylation domain-containing protein [Comamonas testosteroni]|uniref:Prepilin-type N-terminal cleavage/methylation domain-containing protein n=1 Tax=Comamonas testosteroni TaxID=285 RepID=A0A373FPT9_COMTE|nr:type IV pilin protein [Comamonas testosteroni]RGE45389.1 prepilin-type N-terminal cleavage/methylation domain-containing protein [Comamonas testosteroni]